MEKKTLNFLQQYVIGQEKRIDLAFKEIEALRSQLEERSHANKPLCADGQAKLPSFEYLWNKIYMESLTDSDRKILNNDFIRGIRFGVEECSKLLKLGNFTKR